MSDKPSGSFLSAKTFLIFAVVLPSIVGGAVYLGWDKVPPSFQEKLSNVRDSTVEQVSAFSSIPSTAQIPLMVAAATFALIIALGIILLVKNNFKQVVAAVVVFALIGGGCLYYYWDDVFQKEHPEIDAKLAALKQLSQPEEIKPRPLGDKEIQSSGDTVCTTQEYEAAAKFDKLLLLDPTTDVIYPGALIKGETIQTGEYTPIVVDRRPITISASLENIDGEVSQQIKDPKLSSVRDAIKKILNQKVTGATAARNTFEITEIHSSEQLQFAIGANYSYSGGVASVKGGFNFNTTENKSRYLLKFIQSYYTIDMDLPKNPSHVFANPEELDMTLLGEVSPMYVASVTYGRMALFSIESNASSMELKAALEASFKSGVHEGGIDVSGAYKTTLDQSSIKGTIIGGSGADASGAIWGLQGLKDYINKGGNWSHESPAAPLSYKLRYLSDNSIGKMVFATKYKVRNCSKITSKQTKYRVKLDRFFCNMADDEGADWTLEVFGNVSASGTNVSGSKTSNLPTQYLWSKSEAGYTAIGENKSHTINSQKEFVFEDADVDRSYISISGSLTDSDSSSGDDSLGSASKKYFLKEISTTPVSDSMVCSSPHGKITIYFTIMMIQ